MKTSIMYESHFSNEAMKKVITKPGIEIHKVIILSIDSVDFCVIFCSFGPAEMWCDKRWCEGFARNS